MSAEHGEENVHYLDEYPHLEQKVRLRRLAGAALRASEIKVIPFREQEKDSPE